MEAADVAQVTEVQSLRRTASGLRAVAEVAAEMAMLPPKADVYRYLCRQVHRFTDGAVVSVSSIDEDTGCLRVRSVLGIPPAKMKAIDAIIGQRLLGLTTFETRGTIRGRLMSGRLWRLDGEPLDAISKQMPPERCEWINWVMKVLGTPCVHVVGLRHHAKLLGRITILSANSDGLYPIVIEALANVAAVALDRKRTARALRESESRLSAILGAMRDLLFVFDADGRFVYVSVPPSEQYVPPEQAIGRLHGEVMPPEIEAQFARALQRNRQGEAAEFDYELTMHGQPQWYSARLWPMMEEGRFVGSVAVVRNITDRKRLQQQLLQSQKMEALGQLAGGVAHDFRNQLTVIRGFADMLLRRDMVTDEGRDKVQEILKAADRSARLTAQLLLFSRQEVLQPQVVGLRELIGDLGRSLPRMVGEDIRLSVVHHARQCTVELDPMLLQQAVMNLVVNARDAMGGGGELLIETDLADLSSEEAARLGGGAAGRYATVGVVDTGTGMDEAVAARIFEPFFTTKPAGHGTGLGLPMVYGFVRQSGGMIDCDTRLGRGTRMCLYFPLVEGHRRCRAPARQAPEAPPTGRETILIAEDDAAVRGLLGEWLREAGYAVLVAADAAEVLDVARSPGRGVDLLLTDMVMPGMSGAELAQRVGAVRPQTAVLYVSGYLDEDLSRRGVAAPPAGRLLPKPFTRDALLRHVRAALDGAAGPSATA